MHCNFSNILLAGYRCNGFGEEWDFISISKPPECGYTIQVILNMFEKSTLVSNENVVVYTGFV